MIESVTYQTGAAGPKVLMLAGVLGHEKPAILALEQLATRLNRHEIGLTAGQLTLVPRVNALAAVQGRRFIDETLDEIITRHKDPLSHEQKLANALLPLIDAADHVLDLHACAVPSASFACLETDSPQALAFAQALAPEYMLAGWAALTLEKEGAASCTAYALSRGKKALRLVVGQQSDEKAAAAGLQMAQSALVQLGLLPAVPAVSEARRKPRHLRLTHIVRREQEGWLVQPWKNFEYVKAGTAIARYDDGTALTCDHNGYVILPRPEAARGEVWFCLATALDAPGRQA